MTTNSNALENLPPEMQARLSQIMASGQVPVMSGDGPPPQTMPPGSPEQAIGREHYPPAPVQKPPSLMDHLIALRQEVDMMRNEVRGLGQTIEANSNVVEAVGQAVGTIYQMFQQTPNQGATYSSQFQQQVDDGTDY